MSSLGTIDQIQLLKRKATNKFRMGRLLLIFTIPDLHSWLFFLHDCLFKFFLLRFYLFVFREGEREGERGREMSICGCLSQTPCWDLACNLSMCPGWESNRQPFASQAHTQSTELHQPGLNSFSF